MALNMKLKNRKHQDKDTNCQQQHIDQSGNIYKENTDRLHRFFHERYPETDYSPI